MPLIMYWETLQWSKEISLLNPRRCSFLDLQNISMIVFFFCFFTLFSKSCNQRFRIFFSQIYLLQSSTIEILSNMISVNKVVNKYRCYSRNLLMILLISFFYSLLYFKGIREIRVVWTDIEKELVFFYRIDFIELKLLNFLVWPMY